MELDDLKQVWQQQSDGLPPGKETLQELMLGKSKGPLARIRRNLNRELIAVLVCYGITIPLYLFTNGTLYWLMALLLAVVLAVFIGYYIFKLRLLRDMESVQGEVKAHLRRKLQTLEKYIRFYFISGTVLAPLVFVLAAFILFSKDPLGAVRFPHFYTYISIAAIIIALLSYFLNKWYVRRLYGRHVEKMRELMSQLADEPMSR